MLVIKGGRELTGELEVKSAKNSILPIIAGCMLTKEEVKINNCPKISDVESMLGLIEKLGAKYRYENDSIIIDSSSINNATVDGQLSKRLRSSIFILGALLGRLKRAVVSYPGGCDIGLRPIDIHISALKDLGVQIDESGGVICTSGEVKGGEVFFDYASVGATENVMLAASIGDSVTIIHNAAKEPEIVDLADFLNKMGAKITGQGTGKIVIKGVKELHGIEYTPIPDRIVAGTYMLLGAMTAKQLTIKNVRVEHLTSLILKLAKTTCHIGINGDIITIQRSKVKSMDIIETMPYPAFPTDLQAQAMAYATIATGTTVIRENVFETRFRHAEELKRLGANITVRDRTAVIKGVKNLLGATVTATDLRGGAGLVLAGLTALGETKILCEKHIDRGYEQIEVALAKIGADIVRK